MYQLLWVSFLLCLFKYTFPNTLGKCVLHSFCPAPLFTTMWLLVCHVANFHTGLTQMAQPFLFPFNILLLPPVHEKTPPTSVYPWSAGGPGMALQPAHSWTLQYCPSSSPSCYTRTWLHHCSQHADMLAFPYFQKQHKAKSPIRF